MHQRLVKGNRSPRYDICSVEELRTFIAHRGIEFSRRINKSIQHDKRFLVRHLKRADSKWTFPRFLDLPPEIRLLIYRELLTTEEHHRGRVRCWPQILRVCRLVHQEAAPVLYRHNRFTMKIFPFDAGRGMSFIAEGVGHHHSIWQHDTLRQAFREYRGHFQRIRHLAIAIDVDRPENHPERLITGGEKNFTPIHYHLYALCSLLTGTNELQQLKVHLNIDTQNLSLLDTNLLWPLSKLGNANRLLLITGVPSPAVQKILHRLRGSKAAPTNCIADAIPTLRHAEKLRDLLVAVNPARTSSDDALDQAMYPLLALVAKRELVDRLTDRSIRRCTEDLKSYLEGPGPGAAMAAARRKVAQLEDLILDLG